MRIPHTGDERHYNIHTLNRIFAVSSVLLLVGFVVMVIVDYRREWKTYQDEFRSLEIAKLKATIEKSEPAKQEQEKTPAASSDGDFWGVETAGTLDKGAEKESSESPSKEIDRDAVRKELAAIDPESMSWQNKVAAFVRDLPFLDYAAPTKRIDQILVSEYPQDVDFTKAQRVDRCTTCHRGILRPDFEGEEQPFGAHPNLDLFLGSKSPHPIEKFGCTSCHRGEGRGTDFISSAHTPADEAQRLAWETKHNWHRLEHWREDMYAKPFIQAGCLKCHSGQEKIEGAEKLALGFALIERAGCYGCHAIAGLEKTQKHGPSLQHIASRTSKEWIQRWLRNPIEIRPSTWMPRFFDEPSGRPSIRSAAEIRILSEYLIQHSENSFLEAFPPGDIERGKTLLLTVGCLGCHRGPNEEPRFETTLQILRREQGPQLSGLADKTTPAWLYNWLRNPSRLNANARMPNLRLTEQEAADITTYLMQSDSESKPLQATASAEIDFPTQLDAIAVEYAGRAKPKDALLQELAAMTLAEKVDFTGERLIRYYGCAGCHEIPSLNDAVPIGPDLVIEGNKTIHDVDFGLVDTIPKTIDSWLVKKLADPRSFQRPGPQTPESRLHMPMFAFKDNEIEAIVTVLLGSVKPMPENRLVKRLSAREQEIESGRRLVRQKNCRGCHVLEGEGGAIQPTIQEWLASSPEGTIADGGVATLSFSPPNLIGEGKKVRGQWLFDYLGEPQVIRPWLKSRMPTFAMGANERGALVDYFAAIDNEPAAFTVAEDIAFSGPVYEAGKKLFSKEYFDCGNCHIQGEKLPAGSAERWAPDFAVSARRLKPAWVEEWMYNPQPLLPGTKMPTYFDPQYFNDAGPNDILDGDEHRQIEALKNYVFTIGVDGLRDATPALESATTQQSDVTGVDPIVQDSTPDTIK